jgi:hypothetical protein
MKVELHLHTSIYSECAIEPPKRILRTLAKAGYEAVYITEHDAVWSDAELAAIRPKFPDMRIFPGIELSVGEGFAQHLLILGTNDPMFLALRDCPGEAITRAREAGWLTVLAHPRRWDGGAAMLDEGLRPDALEWRTPNQEGPLAEAAADLADRCGLPKVNAGDVHGRRMAARHWIETARPVVEARDIRAIVLEGAYENRSAR